MEEGGEAEFVRRVGGGCTEDGGYCARFCGVGGGGRHVELR